MLSIEEFKRDKEILKTVNSFFEKDSKKYIMGISRDGFAENLSQLVDIDGFIDDFTNETTYLNKPIVKTNDIEKDSLIVVCSTVKTRTACNILKEKGFKYVIDYPTLFKYRDDSNLKIKNN